MQSAAPTGTLDLTYGICRTGTATYSAGDPNCATGVIHYIPGVTQNMGGVISSIVSVNQYQPQDTAVAAPATVNPGETFKVRMAASPSSIPKNNPSPIGDAVVNWSTRFSSVYPIPAGFTVVSHRLIGGDAYSTNTVTPAQTATATLCTTFNTGACTAKLPTQATPIANAWANNTQPYIVVQMPDVAQMGGGLQTTMPTLEVTLQATGASGTIGRFKMTEGYNITNAKPPIVSAQTAHFNSYPTTGSNTGVVPPATAATIVASTTIN